MSVPEPAPLADDVARLLDFATDVGRSARQLYPRGTRLNDAQQSPLLTIVIDNLTALTGDRVAAEREAKAAFAVGWRKRRQRNARPPASE